MSKITRVINRIIIIHIVLFLVTPDILFSQSYLASPGAGELGNFPGRKITEPTSPEQLGAVSFEVFVGSYLDHLKNLIEVSEKRMIILENLKDNSVQPLITIEKEMLKEEVETKGREGLLTFLRNPEHGIRKVTKEHRNILKLFAKITKDDDIIDFDRKEVLFISKGSWLWEFFRNDSQPRLINAN